jgi:hypothetical protein
MQGASISRWTMAYFAAALTFLIIGLAALGSGFGFPSPVADAPETLIVVHLIVIGWLGLLFSGALLQFVPVLAATHLRMPWLAVPAFLLLFVGLGLLIAGFLALGGHVAVDPPVLSAGGILLALGFACLTVSLGTTIVFQKSFGASGVLVLAGLVALVATAATGNVFAGLLSGYIDIPSMVSRLPDLVRFHAASGILGWMTITAIGVSYRLFAMFMLAPDADGSQMRVAVAASCALSALLLAFAFAIFGIDTRTVAALGGVVSAVVGLSLYLNDLRQMFKARRRKALELNTAAGITSLWFLGAGMLLLATDMLVESDLPLGAVAFYLLGMGWLSGLGLAQLYKIVPFLTWLETYGPVMGRTQVPRVQDLVDESHAKTWFAVFYLGVSAGAAAILADVDLLFRAANWCQCAAVVALTIEYARARRLTYAPERMRFPAGAVRPHLIFANTNQ